MEEKAKKLRLTGIPAYALFLMELFASMLAIKKHWLN